MDNLIDSTHKFAKSGDNIIVFFSIKSLSIFALVNNKDVILSTRKHHSIFLFNY